MTKAKLLSTVALALVFSAGAALAQGMNKEAPQQAPAAQQNAPAEKVAPSMKGGEHKAPQATGHTASDTKSAKPQTTGQASPESKASRSAESKDSKSAKPHEAESKSAKPRETTGQSPKSDMDEKSSTQHRDMDKDKGNDRAMDKDRDNKSGRSDVRSRDENGSRSGQSTTERDRTTTTGQGAASGSAKLSTEQRTKITSIIHEHRVEPTHLNVSVSIGTRIPSSVHVYALPREVVTIYPEWRGYDYILVGDQIVIINPRTHEIVAIVEA